MTPALAMKGVTRSFGSGHTEVTALGGVTLMLSPGEMIAVMGPSGSGKTTLLSLAGGLDQPTRGAIDVEGTDLASLSYSEMARLRRTRIGYVFQQFNLIDGLTAAENVSLPLELDGTHRRVAHEAALEDPTGGTAFDPAHINIPAVAASSGLYNERGGDIPTVIISPERASELGFTADAPYRAIVRAAAPITDEQLAAAKTAASDFPGLSVFGLADTRYDSGPFRAALLGFAAVIALAIIAVAVALVAAESRRDRAILAAVGSAPNTRRLVAGYRALLLTGLAGWLAIPAGFLPITLIQTSSRGDYPFVIPWLTFAVVAVVLPLVAGAAGALLSRRPATAQMLRPIA